VVVHVGAIRQNAKLIAMTSELCHSGDRTRATFSFLYHPEYVTKGSIVLFREGLSKGVGRVTRAIHR
jgi:GTPase